VVILLEGRPSYRHFYYTISEKTIKCLPLLKPLFYLFTPFSFDFYPMKTRLFLRLLLLPLTGVFILSTSSAQVYSERYNAGYDSGWNGINSVFVGPYAGKKTTSIGFYNSFVGFASGSANTDGSNNSFFGYRSGYRNTLGNNNSFFGFEAGSLNGTGNNNLFVGYQSGSYNKTGNGNSFLGTKAGFFNAGSFNTFVGNTAGQENRSGEYNSFLGSSAGKNNTTGSYNSFLGSSAGFYNTTGNNNSFVGFRAGEKNTSGSFNSFLGFWTGKNNTTGSHNNFTGVHAGSNNTTGSSNNFVGAYTGVANTTGSFNSFEGYFAGYSNTTGVRNTMVGAFAGFNNSTGNRNVFLGDSTALFATGSSNVYIGSEAGRGSYASLNSASNNLFVGAKSGLNNSSGKENTFLGSQTGLTNTTGSNNLILGSFANTSSGSLSNSIAIGSKAYVTASNSLVLGSINGVNGAVASTNVGIGTSAPAYRLQLGENSAAKPGTSTWTVASDKRLKRDVATFADGLEVLTKIKPVWFKYNGEAGMPTDKKYVGIIAQEMQKIAPYTVGTFTYQDTTGKTTQYLDYDANALTYILVNSVKELKQENTALQQQLVEKDARIESLEVRLNKLEQLITKQVPGITAEGDETARLWQNEPNPTEGATIIRYLIPQNALQAQISVYSINGQQLKSFDISERGEGQLSVTTTTMPSGTYIYRLVIDGKPIDAKKLVLSK
jgi:trimeric autotransporter adhesin